jgi:hypothetical protein
VNSDRSCHVHDVALEGELPPDDPRRALVDLIVEEIATRILRGGAEGGDDGATP